VKNDAVLSTIPMSRGSGWVYELRGKPGDYWPESGQAYVIFYESTGGVITTLEGSLKPELLSFDYEATDVALVPHGAGFEIFVTPDSTGVPIMVRYGTVTRREVRFPDAPAVDLTDTALLYGDKFDRSFFGPRWITMAGQPNIAGGTAGTVNQLFTLNETAALLYWAPLNGDDMTINCKFANVGDGAAGMIFCSDASMTSYLGFVIEQSTFLWSSAKTVHIVRAYTTGHGPLTNEHVVSLASNTANNDNFVIKYNSQTDTVKVYKNNSDTALISWTDTTHSVPHGEGFRYLGMNFWTGALFSTGPRIDEWTAKDGI
jgi:hypothetical protein